MFAPVDFTSDNAADTLEAAGHDCTQDSLFVCEGVLLYLDEPVIVRLLAGLCRRATPGSVLAVNFPVRAARSDGLHLRRRVLDVVLSLAGEPPRTQLTREDALELLGRAVWVPRRVVDPADLNPRARPGHVLLVEATPGASTDGGGSPGANRDTAVGPEGPETKRR